MHWPVTASRKFPLPFGVQRVHMLVLGAAQLTVFINVEPFKDTRGYHDNRNGLNDSGWSLTPVWTDLWWAFFRPFQNRFKFCLWFEWGISLFFLITCPILTGPCCPWLVEVHGLISLSSTYWWPDIHLTILVSPFFDFVLCWTILLPISLTTM